MTDFGDDVVDEDMSCGEFAVDDVVVVALAAFVFLDLGLYL